jgi:hypothetical protein
MPDLHNPMRQWLEVLNAGLEILTGNQSMPSSRTTEIPALVRYYGEKPVGGSQTRIFAGSILEY